MDPNLITAWHGICLLIIPGLIALACKPDWSPLGKFAVALIFCFGAAFVELLLSGQTCSFANFPAMFRDASILVFAGYAGILKPLDSLGLLKLLENKGNS